MHAVLWLDYIQTDDPTRIFIFSIGLGVLLGVCLLILLAGWAHDVYLRYRLRKSAPKMVQLVPYTDLSDKK